MLAIEILLIVIVLAVAALLFVYAVDIVYEYVKLGVKVFHKWETEKLEKKLDKIRDK